jgi:hypothetical protein
MLLVRSHDEAMAQVLAYLAAAVIAEWGVSHAIPPGRWWPGWSRRQWTTIG